MSRRKKWSEVWEYFKESEEGKAVCITCNKTLSYASTTANLKNHLKCKHSGTMSRRKKCSEVWQYFKESEGGKAVCIKCNQTLSYASTTANLKNHLNCKHSGTVSRRKKCSEVWQYFKESEGGKAVCITCNESLSFKSTTANLRSHLQRKHVALYKNLPSVKKKIENIFQRHRRPSFLGLKVIIPSQPESTTNSSLHADNISRKAESDLSVKETIQNPINIYIPKQISEGHKELVGKDGLNLRIGAFHPISILEERPIEKPEYTQPSDSMPLQQRLNTIAASNTLPQREDSKPPPLKSQPLSPTKLKVTRQSTSKSIPEAEPAPDNSSNEEVCLRWNSHHSNMQSAFPSLLSKEQYCDVTLVADGKSLKCHKLILSSCSSYFDQVLEKITPYQHPVIFMKDIPFNILKSLCDFMYAGEVNILQGDLHQLLAVAESLKIKGLANKVSPNNTDHSPVTDEFKETKEPHHPQQTNKEASLSKFVKIAPKPSGVGVVQKGGANGDVTDPLDLMEPTYEEEAIVDLPPQLAPKKTDPARRSLGKRVRKRKHIGDEDHESSPPVFRSRKGTRSRPNVKVPRYFNASFDNSNEKLATTETSEHQQETGIDPCTEPLLELLEEIKTEPVDIEDSMIEDSYDSARSTSTRQLAPIIPKVEKEDDDPDPLNVEASDGSHQKQTEENVIQTSLENSVVDSNIENSEPTGHVDDAEPGNPVENLVSNDSVEHSASRDLVENSEPSHPAENYEHGDPVENSKSSDPVENSEPSDPVENSESSDPVENSESRDLVVTSHSGYPVENLTSDQRREGSAIESCTNENTPELGENRHEFLSVSEACSASEELPENNQT